MTARQQPARPARVMSLASRLIVGGLLPRIDHAVEESTRPFTRAGIMRPDGGARRFGMVHYGIFLPGLPEPFRYCNVMTLLGGTGAVIMDNDYLQQDPPSDTATLLCSTALGGEHHYQSYSIARECRRNEGDLQVSFGDHLRIRGDYPVYQVEAAWGDFRMDITVRCTDTVSWFVRNAIYDHLSLLSTCSGSITQNGRTLRLDDHLCTFEYARSASPYALSRRVIPDAWKLPADFFTYQIINLDASTQLLLTDVRSLGRTAFKGVHVRDRDGRAEVHVEDVVFEVLEREDKPAVAPDGGLMWLPRRFRWRVREAGITLLDITCQPASPWRFGHGRGYAGSYRFSGEYRGRPVAGDGYIEYIDCESR